MMDGRKQFPFTIDHSPFTPISKFSDKSKNLDTGLPRNAGFAPY